MNLPLANTAAEAAYLEAGAMLPADSTRREAFETFAATGLPHRRWEDWRWTDLRQLLARPYPPARERAIDVAAITKLARRSILGSLRRSRLIIADGVYRPDISELPVTGGISVTPISRPRKLPGSDPLLLLTTAFLTGGLRIEVAAGETTALPIEIIIINSGEYQETYSPRIELQLGKGSALTLIESHFGAKGSYVSLPVTAVWVGEGARLDRIKIQDEAAGANHLSHNSIELGREAVLRDFTFSIGAALTRNQGFVAFVGEGGDARVTGGYLIHGRQHCDTRLEIDHKVPRCTSREIFKCVIDEEARGIFQGKVIVQPHAQKTDGKQSSHALLLSPNAEFDAKPELEIFADDVVCGHGATAGDLNEDHVFYLRSRGIPEERARGMLIAAFVAEAFDDVADETLRAALAARAESWLAQR